MERIIAYLCNNVKIIVNIESNFVQSEDIFANLNDNHVPLTDAYLIKGLLITNAVSRVNVYGRSLEYTEIQEKTKKILDVYGMKYRLGLHAKNIVISFQAYGNRL